MKTVGRWLRRRFMSRQSARFTLHCHALKSFIKDSISPRQWQGTENEPRCTWLEWVRQRKRFEGSKNNKKKKNEHNTRQDKREQKKTHSHLYTTITGSACIQICMRKPITKGRLAFNFLLFINSIEYSINVFLRCVKRLSYLTIVSNEEPFLSPLSLSLILRDGYWNNSISLHCENCFNTKSNQMKWNEYKKQADV